MYLFCVFIMLFFGAILQKKGYYVSNVSEINMTYNTRIYLNFSIAVMFVMIAFRDMSVGIDTEMYYKIYRGINEGYLNAVQLNSIHEVLTSGKAELGYALLQFFFGQINASFRVFLIFTTLIMSAGYYQLFKRSENIIVSILLFIGFGYLSYSMCYIRQMFAVAISIYALKYIEERRFIRFLLLVLLAYTFHNTAIIILPFYFLYNMKFTSRFKLGSVIAILIANVGSTALFMFIRRFARLNYPFDPDAGGGILNLILIGTAVLALLYGHLMIERNIHNKLLVYAMIACAVVYPISSGAEATMRLMYFYNILIILFVPALVQTLKEAEMAIYGSDYRRIALFIQLGYIAAAIAFFVDVIMKANQFYPYKFMF